MTSFHPAHWFFRATLACAALLLVSRARASDTPFIAGLSADERTEIGVPKLTAAQAANLDILVSHDADLAQQGGVTGFSSGFLARHTQAECAAAGIATLSDSERVTLDRLVARAVAMGPPPDQAYTYSPPKAKPTPPPPPPERLVSAPLHAEIHGDVSLTVGGGSHGSSFYGSSLDLNVTDPSGKFTLGVSIDQFHGKGPLPYYGPFAPYGPYSAYGPLGPAEIGPPYWGW